MRRKRMKICALVLSLLVLLNLPTTRAFADDRFTTQVTLTEHCFRLARIPTRHARRSTGRRTDLRKNHSTRISRLAVDLRCALEEGDLKDIRAILGNDAAIKAYREATLPFPDGTIIARLAWSHDASEENNKSFGRAQSFVAGAPKNGVQFMVKDSKKYAATGGWGYAHFDDGMPADDALLNKCFPCHQAVKDRDFVFTRYAP